MAKQCRIERNSNGQIQSVKDSAGNESSLFDSLNNILKDKEISLEYYGISETADFREVNGSNEATPKELFEFNNSSEKNPLNNQEILELQNAMLSTNANSSGELYENLYKVLVNSNGIITFNENRLKTIYNDFEISRIVSSPEVQQTIKQSFLKLKNTPEITFDYNALFSIPVSTSLNLFGKQISSNPYVMERQIDETVAGAEQKNIVEELDDNIADRYATNSEFKSIVDEKTSTLRIMPLMTVVDGDLIQKEENIKNYLQDIIIPQSNPRLSEDIDFIRSISPTRWEQNRQDIQEIIENITDRAKDNGIDLRDFSTLTQAMPREEIISFLNSLEDALENPTEENLNTFGDNYNSILKATTPITETIISQNEFDTPIETNLSEYEMFRNFNMVKKSDGVYRKVSEQSLEELYNNFFQSNGGFDTVDDLIKYVQEKGIQKLNITDFQFDNDVLEKMYLYKEHFGFNLDTTPASVKTEDLYKINIDMDEFVREFNKFGLKTDNPYFSVNDRGINISSNDPITTVEALNTLPPQLIEQITQYNAVSKNLNLDLPIETDYQNLDSKLEKRLNAVNNPQSVSKLSGEYTYLEDGVMAVKNESEDFVRTPTGVYEMIYEQDNIKFYGKLPQASQNYKLSNVESPLSNIDFEQYRYLETAPEVFQESKKYYTNKELENINQQYFNCQ